MTVITYVDTETRNAPILLDEPFELTIASGTATQAGAISDDGPSFGIEKTGVGTLILTGENAYTGPTTISAGRLVLAPAGITDTPSAFTIASGATLAFGDDASLAFLASITGAGNVDLGAATFLELDHVTPGMTFAGSIFDDADGQGYFAICGCGGGSLTLTGHSDIGGFLEVGADALLILDGGSFTSNSTDQSQAIISGTLRVLNGGDLNTTWIQCGGSLVVDGAGSTATASTDTTIGTALTISNGGLLTSSVGAFLSGFPDQAATGDVSGTGSLWDVTGMLELGSVVPSAEGIALLTIRSGGRVEADGIALVEGSTIRLGTGGAAGSLSASTIVNDGAILANFTNATTLAAAISGSGRLDKDGGGALTLTGASTYAGATTVAEGRLNVNGSIASATSVEAGGTLGGRGTVGAVTIASGGSLSPGTSAGNITTGSLAFSSGARFAVEIGGTSPGTGYDRATVLGTVSLANATLDLTLLAGFSPAFGNSFTIIANDGTDAVSGRFAGYAEGAVFLLGGRLMSITYAGGDGNDVVIAKTPPPTTIIGTAATDLIDATHTVTAQPLPTSGADLIEGLGGNDRIDALGGDDQVRGGVGGDRIFGSAGHDAIAGGDGKDVLSGGSENDTIGGGKARDEIRGDSGDDLIKGGDGPDIITGGAGNDTIDGQQKDDLIKGGDGDDWLAGGGGSDKLIGGEGADTFVFRQRKASDKVADFTEVDTIALVKSAFPGIGPKGVLKAKYYHEGPEALTAKQKILYDEDSGWLLYARHGSDTANPLAFAKIGKHLDDFDRHDILVI